MKIPPDLSGVALASHQRIAVPAHRALRVGTLSGILRAVAHHKGVSRDEILEKP